MGDLVRNHIVDIADKAQRHMVIPGVDQRPGKSAAQHGQVRPISARISRR
jgi:hypothetical protein